MQIAQLKVRIGDHEVSLADCTDENPDIKKLLEKATSSSAVVTIEVPQDEETASVLGRLTYGVPKSKVKVVDTDMITPLSKRLDELELSVRSRNALRNTGLVYVWQVAEWSEGDFLCLKDFGTKSLNEIKEILAEMRLRLSMDLSKVRDLLPNPNPTP